MLDRIRKWIRDTGLFAPGDRVLAGVSGGADSVALLLVLQALAGELGLSEVAAVHVHHGIRGGEADRDATFVRSFCRERGVRCFLKEVDVPAYAAEARLSLEEAARILRYRAFDEARQEWMAEHPGPVKTALAHHRDDQAETILFRLVRGSGLKGLSGMAPVRDGVYVRPLLPVGRAEIEAFLRDAGVPWVTDSTNACADASRNRIRLEVMPALAAVRPDAAEKIAEAGAYFGEADAHFRKEAADWLARNARYADDTGRVLLPGEAIGSLDGIQREYVAAAVLRSFGVSMKDVGRVHLKQAAALAGKQPGKQARIREVLFTKGYEGIEARRAPEGGSGGTAGSAETGIGPASAASAESAETGISPGTAGNAGTGSGGAPEDVRQVRLISRVFSFDPSMKIPEKEYTKWFDYDTIKGTAELRTRAPGDRFSTRRGTHRKLKDFLIDRKIPREARDSLLLAAAGPDVLWVVGVRMSEAHKVTEQTKTVLELTVEGVHDG
ncbi:MAG: tRNA lysidine(34) synthetase TilS [Lachnospiraceae bacterium]|nr:tRNA lysidine(34) synthetase TilS [Lachnospiraceae bacterium]